MSTAIAASPTGQMPMPYQTPAQGHEWTPGSTAFSHQIGPRDLLRMIHRHRGVMLAIIGVITLGVLVQQLLSPTLYRSSSNMQIELIDEVGTNQADVNSRNAERVANAVRLHRSRSAAEQVIRDLDLLKDPRFLAELGKKNLSDKALLQAGTNKLISMIAVSAQSGSDLVEITVTSRSPELAAEIANQLPASVRSLRNMKSNERRAELLASLELELQARDDTAKEAAAAVARFRQDNQMLNGAGSEEDLAQINRVAAQSAVANAARAGSAAHSAGVQRAAGMQSTAMATSGALEQLERQRGELLSEMSKLGTSLGPNHPDVRRINSQIDNVNENIAKERARVQSAAQSVASADAARMAELARSEADRDAAQASQLNGMLASLNAKAYNNSRNMVELQRLTREAKLTNDAYESIASRVEQVRAQMQLEGVSSSLVSPAVPDFDPIAPAPVKMTIAALLASTVLAFLVALTRDFLDDRLRNSSQIRRLFGVPTLGMLPLVTREFSDDPKDSPVITDPQSLFAEVARSTYCEVKALRTGPGAQVVLVSSPLPGDGKSTVSLTLAAAGIAMGDRTVVLDLDLRKRGALQRLQNEMQSPDLVDIVSGRADLDSLALPHAELRYEGYDPGAADGEQEPYKLVLLSAKEPVAEPAVLLSSNRLKHLLEQLRERFDTIIINAPAALAVRDARAMCHFADQTVMVARWGHTTSDQMRAALEMLNQNVGGVIFDRVDYPEHARRRYGDAVQFYADSSAYYTSPLPTKPSLGESLRGWLAGFGRRWKPAGA